MSLLGLLAFIGIALGIYRAARIPLAAAPPLAVATIIILLYGAALAGWLQSGATLLFVVGLVCFTREAFATWKARWSAPWLQPSIALPLLASLVLYWRLHDASFLVWDDFSHWALGSREMMQRHRLADATSLLSYKDYPPGTNLFHYFVLRLAGPTEGGIITVHAWLLFWMLTPLFFALRWRHLLVAVAALVGTFLFVNVLGSGLQTATVDHVLGVFFASALMTYFCLRQGEKNPLWVLPLVFALPLIKHSGSLLAVMVVVIISVDFILSQRERGRRVLSPAVIAAFVVLLATPFAAKASWQRYLNANNIEIVVPVHNVKPAQLLHEWSAEGSDRSKTVRGNFFAALDHRPLSHTTEADILVNRLAPAGGAALIRRFTFAQWTLAVAGMLAISLVLGSFLSRARITALIITCGIGWVVYLTGLLALYTMFFGEESLYLASYERYMNTYAAAVALVALFLLQGVVRENRRWRGWISAGVVGLLFLFQTPSLALFRKKPPSDPIRTALRPMLDAVRAVVPPDKSIHTLYQNSPGSEVVRMRFDLAPRRWNSLWTIGEPYFEGDVWTVNIAPEAFATMLRALDYLLLARVDDKFWQRYGSLFAPEDRGSDVYLFRIDASQADKTRFIPVLRRGMLGASSH